MNSRPSQLELTHWIVPAALAMLLAAILQACTSGVETLQAQAATPTPTLSPISPLPSSTPVPPTPMPQPTHTAPPSTATAPPPTLTPTFEYIPSPYPTSLEAFGLHYDPDATLRMPPWGSLSMLFWGDAIPVTPVFATPEFVPQPTPQGLERSGDGLLQLGCELDRWGWATCPPDNPLQPFGCTVLEDPERLSGGTVDPRVSVSGVDPGIEDPDRPTGGTEDRVQRIVQDPDRPTGGTPLVAICKIRTEEHEAARINGLYLSGCAFKTENHYVFEVGGEYLLVSSTGQLQDLFAPIESPQEAVSYAQLVTGLKAIYDFTYDPYLIYFFEIIQGTHVSQTGDVYEMNLFNAQGCGCEPWFTTQITIRVDRSGQVAWLDAVPIYMTTGWSCAD